MTRHYLGLSEIAAHTGLERSTVKSYADDGQMPPADVAIGGIRGWRVQTIDKWMANRPGRGARTDLAKRGSKSR
ncbi:helix-turn-helix transcriptional regulator [Microbacterium lacus]|uniref:helix-turn-helix transcriptional regulator n=1 Tax=Microbacterium lacus TaxID=415217 RepID=UPI000C2C6505|nr:transcriptional regulator [Microbacterium lacus]